MVAKKKCAFITLCYLQLWNSALDSLRWKRLRDHMITEYSYVSFWVKRAGGYDLPVMIPSFVSGSWEVCVWAVPAEDVSEVQSYCTKEIYLICMENMAQKWGMRPGGSAGRDSGDLVSRARVGLTWAWRSLVMCCEYRLNIWKVTIIGKVLQIVLECNHY